MVKMVLSASQTQASSAKTKTQTLVQAYEKIIQSLQLFINEGQLESQAYNNAKGYYQSVLIPFVKASILLTEEVAVACQKFTSTYKLEVETCDLDSDILERQIHEAQMRLDHLEAIRYGIQSKELPDNVKERQLVQNERTIERVFDMKRVLEDKLEKLFAFEASSPQIFASIDALKAAVAQGKAQTDAAWNGSSFTMPTDLSWTNMVASNWQVRDKQAKGIDDKKVEQLKEYTVYAVVYYDMDGNPQIMWQLEKDGKGVKNPELYQYLKKAGQYLTPDMFEFMAFNAWDEKIKEGWRNGLNYVTGEEYNKFLAGMISTSQYVEDGYTWLTESELGTALMALGFTYATYRLTTKSGTSTVSNEKVGGAKGLIGTDFEDFLTKDVGGKGSFSVHGRDFDGGLGSRWWEAKSGRYWERNCQVGKGFEKFKSDMGSRLKIAKDSGATYELFSNTPIPQHVKDWLTKKGIKFTEYLD